MSASIFCGAATKDSNKRAKKARTDSKYNKINLANATLYINFAARNEVDRFEQLATTVKNAKTAVLYCLHILSTIPFHLIEN